MLLQPKKTKFKKFKKKYLSKSIETRSYKLQRGSVGLKALGSFRITSRQIEAIRQCMNRDLGRRGKIWINIHLQAFLLWLKKAKIYKIPKNETIKHSFGNHLPKNK